MTATDDGDLARWADDGGPGCTGGCPMTLRECQLWVWEAMGAKGFHAGRTGSGRDDTLVRLCLIHTEVSEAAQVVKRRHLADPDAYAAFGEELADIAVRLLDLCGCVGIDLEQAIAAKMAKNMARPHKYGTPDEGRWDDPDEVEE